MEVETTQLTVYGYLRLCFCLFNGDDDMFGRGRLSEIFNLTSVSSELFLHSASIIS